MNYKKVISLFLPYLFIKTSILLFDKNTNTKILSTMYTSRYLNRYVKTLIDYPNKKIYTH